MTDHGSATAHEEKPHVTVTTQITIRMLSDVARNQCKRQIDRSRVASDYSLRFGDQRPWLADLVRRADAGETIIDTTDFSPTDDNSEIDSSEERIEALAEIICQAGDESAAALFVLMGTLENSTHPKVLANAAKHLAFSRCGELNLFGMVDVQLALVEGELFPANTPVS